MGPLLMLDSSKLFIVSWSVVKRVWWPSVNSFLLISTYHPNAPKPIFMDNTWRKAQSNSNLKIISSLIMSYLIWLSSQQQIIQLIQNSSISLCSEIYKNTKIKISREPAVQIHFWLANMKGNRPENTFHMTRARTGSRTRSGQNVKNTPIFIFAIDGRNNILTIGNISWL